MPVLPGEIGPSIRGNGIEHEVYGLGKINVIKDRGLAEYTIDSFFPAVLADQKGKALPPYISTSIILEPMEYVRKIMKWWETKRPIRFVAVMGNEEINTAASIESFEWGESAGSPGDISYILKLKEYRFYFAQRAEVLEESGGEVTVQKSEQERADERVIPKTYTLIAGDNLWKVAQQMLGDGSRWREIQKLNGISDAQLKSLKIGMVLKLPTGGGTIA